MRGVPFFKIIIIIASASSSFGILEVTFIINKLRTTTLMRLEIYYMFRRRFLTSFSPGRGI